jgi:nucleoside phosphorylase
VSLRAPARASFGVAPQPFLVPARKFVVNELRSCNTYTLLEVDARRDQPVGGRPRGRIIVFAGCKLVLEPIATGTVAHVALGHCLHLVRVKAKHALRIPPRMQLPSLQPPDRRNRLPETLRHLPACEHFQLIAVHDRSCTRVVHPRPRRATLGQHAPRDGATRALPVTKPSRQRPTLPGHAAGSAAQGCTVTELRAASRSVVSADEAGRMLSPMSSAPGPKAIVNAGRTPSARRTAVIITALQIERTAVVEHLRNASREPPLNGSIYRRGAFDEGTAHWDVIVAEIGPGNLGAAAEAERVVSHYRPDIALFVGVAGAVKDLRHGDVVASTKVYGYESGKDGEEFNPRPEFQKGSYNLEQLARYEAGERGWKDRIKGDGESTQTMDPNARAAPIAAGEKVVASNRSATYKFIRKHYGDALAVEMEGLGFLLGVHMNHPTEGLVVRGISDLVDDKDQANDETWQPIAARHAAAFAFQILATYTNQDGRSTTKTPQIDATWQEHHLRDAAATAGPRYSSALSMGTPLHDVFEALGGTATWSQGVLRRRRELSKLLRRFREGVETKHNTGWGTAFPEHLQAAGRALVEQVEGLEQALTAIAAIAEDASPATMATSIRGILPKARELAAALRGDIEGQHGKGATDNAGFRQFQAEYQMAFPMANLDLTNELVQSLEELHAWCDSGPGRASNSKNGVLLLGDAGVGKTHGICDIGYDRMHRGLYTVVLFGEHFASAEEPWERIRQLLGFPPTSRDQLLGALDAAAAASGAPLLLCIDGLNETRPRTYWRSWLASFVTQVAQHPNIRLCVSCRSTYEGLVVPQGHGLDRVEHVGFAGIEFTACRHFFEHYGLEPPIAPSFHPEFSNPLFLRLACETLQASGELRMPTGWRGLATVIQAFLREKNKAFAWEFEGNKRDRVPQLALREFIGEAERLRRVYLGWSEASRVVNRSQPGGMTGSTVLDWLVNAGLMIVDADPTGGPDGEEVVRIAFERFGDHLLAERLLAGVPPGETAKAIESGSLSFAFASNETVLQNRGLVEALSIQLPEHPDHAVELAEVLQPSGPREEVLRATIAALPWRAPEHMTTRTKSLVYEGLTTNGYGHEVLGSLLAVATEVTAPDALWLHALLARQDMPSRDAFLCGYLHDSVDQATSVERLLRNPFEVDSASVPEAVALRWAILLLWFCVAADRRVRDRATKGLVALTESRPKLWVTLIEEFASVDDEYVLERCFCAAYGALLRSREPEAERAVAAATFRAIFADPTAVQNALVRDHARCIIELADRDDVLPPSVDLARVKPPHKSDWPLAMPSQEQLAQYKESRKQYPKLYSSCLDDDFYTYTLSGLRHYEHAMSREKMGQWILHHVISDLAYGGEALASYDGYTLYKHGGGRGRPRWAERIGKKYQWIALSRLAARLGDHVKPKRERWDPPIQRSSLVYSRGRDIDPGLLAREPPRGDGSAWWLRHDYDFAAVATQSNSDWTNTPTDVPPSDELLQPIPRSDGGDWQVLEAYPTWSANTLDDNGDGFTPRRQVWTQIRGYLVKQKSAERMFKWMSEQHFMGRWMPEGQEFHEGFLGEYPWGALFSMYPDRWQSVRATKRAPARVLPACHSISSSYEEDSYQGGGITVHVPAREFFEKDQQLRWDGLGGYRDADGRVLFLDPSAGESGPSALLIDRQHLLAFLQRNGLAVLWSALGEKIFIGGHADASPRLEFSRAHMLDATGTLKSSNLVIGGLDAEDAPS